MYIYLILAPSISYHISLYGFN